MSIDAAIGRIDQILTLRQQVADPAAFAAGTSTTSSTTAGTSATGASGASGSDFASLLAQAQGGTVASALTGDAGTTGLTGATGLTDATGLAGATGLTGATGLAGVSGLAATTGLTAAGATSPADPRITAMIQQADSLIGKPYVWGGGHSGWGPQTGYDCSGFVSSVLHAGGYLSSPQDTQNLPSQPGIESGPGQYVTIYDRTDAGGSDHVIISINGQFYESGGETGAWGGGGGVARIGTPSAAYLATFNDVLHPAGL